MDFNQAHRMLLQLRKELESMGEFPPSYKNPFIAILNRVEMLAGQQLLEKKRAREDKRAQ